MLLFSAMPFSAISAHTQFVRSKCPSAPKVLARGKNPATLDVAQGPCKKQEVWPLTDSDCSTHAESAESSLISTHVPQSGSLACPLPAPSARCNHVIIFDWDDTLSPTTHFKSSYGLPTGCTHTLTCVEEMQMEEHAERVEAVLRAAAATAHVSILTLGTQPWLARSAASYIPTLDIAQVLQELGITTYFAQDDAVSCPGALERGIAGDLDGFVLLKRSAMERCLRDWREKGVLVQGADAMASRTSVTSIGDGNFEREALIMLMKEQDSKAECKGQPLCHTVKLMDNPSAHDLGRELHHLPALLRHIALCDADFDLCVGGPDELMAHRLTITI